MSVKHFLDAAPLNNIVRYKGSPKSLEDCIPFSGAPRKHPYDKDKLVLIANPFSHHTTFYEFNLSDIVQIDDLPGIATEHGENLVMAKLWVVKGALGLRYEPFEVADPLRFLEDSELLHQGLTEKP